jgi:hypothetical protein
MLVANARNGKALVNHHHESQEFKSSAIAENSSLPIHSAMDLQHILARSISQRTGGRVRLPQVRILGSRVVLSGWATSYYAVQLALVGLLEGFRAVGLDRPDVVELEIEVVPEQPAKDPETELMRTR